MYWLTDWPDSTHHWYSCQVDPANRLTAEELKSLRFITKYIDTSRPFEPKRLKRYLRSFVHPRMKEESRRRRRERKQKMQELQIAHQSTRPASATSATASTATPTPSNGSQGREEHQVFHGLPDQSPRDRSSSSPSALPLPKDYFAVSPPHQKRTATKRQPLVVDTTTRERSSSSSPRPTSSSRREHMRTNSYGDSGRSYHRNVSSGTSDILAELESLALSVSTPASSTSSSSEKRRKSEQHRRSSHHNQEWSNGLDMCNIGQIVVGMSSS